MEENLSNYDGSAISGAQLKDKVEENREDV